VSVDDRSFVLPSLLFVVFGLFCLGCTSKEEAEQKPPIAKVELPPAAKTAKEEPSQKETPSSAEEKVPTETRTPPPSSIRTGAVAARLLNVRSAPNLMAPEVGILRRGEQVQILGEEDAWYHIKAYGGYLEGWAAKSYITVSPAEESGAPSS
jgi:uncharacterized protein YgiM (DUF1202 family)